MENKKISLTDSYALLALAMQFILQILGAYIFKIDAAGRLPAFLLFTAFLVTVPWLKWNFLKGPLILYFFLAVWLFINGYVQKGYLLFETAPVWQLFRKTITPPIFLILCSSMLKRRERETVKVLFYTTCFYLITYCLFKAVGAESEVNENTAALVLIANVVLLCYGRMKKLFSPLLFAATVVLSLAETILIGSRMGLAVVFYLYFVFAALKMSGKNGARKIMTFVLCAIALSISILVSLKYTEVGTRMMETTEQTDTFSISTGTIFDKFGDRGLQYYFSWPYFISSPFVGIGLNNWINFNPVETVCHSEYLVQYLENGLVAFVPYILFLYLLMHSIHKEYRRRSDKSRMELKFVYLSMFGVLFCNLVIWTNDQFAVFVIYALCHALSRPRGNYRKNIVKSVCQN